MRVTQFNVGRWCLSEDECIAQGINFAAYEKGVSDAAEAFGRNRAPTLPLLTDADWQAIADSSDRIIPGALKAAVEERIRARFASGVPVRCPLCSYQHGHAIGCANNPVDIALASGVQAAPAYLSPEACKQFAEAHVAAKRAERRKQIAAACGEVFGWAKPDALLDTQAELDAVTREMDVIYERWPKKDDRTQREELLMPLRARCVEIGQRRYRIAAGVKEVPRG